MSRIVSKQQSLYHYKWGDNCDGWNLSDEENLVVKQESMPPGTSEVKHLHKYAQQFFYILKGIATFEIGIKVIKVTAGEGLLIKAGEGHKIRNNGTKTLEFILCSQPPTANDRINLEP